MTNPNHRDQVRSLLARTDPALLAFCDAARERFDAKLTGLALRNSAGQMEAIGALHQPEKPDGR